MSSTFFTAAPHWRWLIVAYFFLGGLAGGSYFLATMMDLFGKREDRPLVRLNPPAPLGRLVTAVGALLGLYLAGYTGVLLAVTNRPIWADTTLLGLTFLISAASTSAALLILFGSFGGGSRDGIRALERLDASVLVLEGLAIAALVASLGRVAMVWLNGWGLLLAGVMLGGIGLPLLLHWRRPSRDSRWWIGPALVLLGGLTLRESLLGRRQCSN